MYYEPSTGREFAAHHTFRLAYPHTSFGDLNTEAERNAAGLFTLDQTYPNFNPLTHALSAEGVEQVGALYKRRYVVQPVAVQELRDNLRHAVTARRWELETGGVTLPGGIRVGSSTEDQNRITSVIANAQLAGVASVDFKAQSGWVTLSLEQVRGIAAAIALHVQACFSAERKHHEAIAACTDDALSQYDMTTGWPAGAAP